MNKYCHSGTAIKLGGGGGRDFFRVQLTLRPIMFSPLSLTLSALLYIISFNSGMFSPVTGDTMIFPTIFGNPWLSRYFLTMLCLSASARACRLFFGSKSTCVPTINTSEKGARACKREHFLFPSKHPFLLQKTLGARFLIWLY